MDETYFIFRHHNLHIYSMSLPERVDHVPVSVYNYNRLHTIATMVKYHYYHSESF